MRGLLQSAEQLLAPRLAKVLEILVRHVRQNDRRLSGVVGEGIRSPPVCKAVVLPEEKTDLARALPVTEQTYDQPVAYVDVQLVPKDRRRQPRIVRAPNPDLLQESRHDRANLHRHVLRGEHAIERLCEGSMLFGFHIGFCVPQQVT
ncbi:MAG: hypothetical protein U5K81_13875 [Trueperaceae bacterium]|nr:hypothetical protein [Trueperaceae bacterium]